MIYSLFDHVVLITRLIGFEHFKDIAFSSSFGESACFFSLPKSFTHRKTSEDALVESLGEFDRSSIEHIA